MGMSDVEKVAFDGGVSHGPNGVAVVHHLRMVFGVGGTRLEVYYPGFIFFGGKDHTVGTQHPAMPNQVALVEALVLWTEKPSHFGLTQHLEEGVLEFVCDGVGVVGIGFGLCGLG